LQFTVHVTLHTPPHTVAWLDSTLHVFLLYVLTVTYGGYHTPPPTTTRSQFTGAVHCCHHRFTVHWLPHGYRFDSCSSPRSDSTVLQLGSGSVTCLPLRTWVPLRTDSTLLHTGSHRRFTAHCISWTVHLVTLHHTLHTHHTAPRFTTLGYYFYHGSPHFHLTHLQDSVWMDFTPVRSPPFLDSPVGHFG